MPMPPRRPLGLENLRLLPNQEADLEFFFNRGLETASGLRSSLGPTLARLELMNARGEDSSPKADGEVEYVPLATPRSISADDYDIDRVIDAVDRDRRVGRAVARVGKRNQQVLATHYGPPIPFVTRARLGEYRPYESLAVLVALRRNKSVEFLVKLAHDSSPEGKRAFRDLKADLEVILIAAEREYVDGLKAAAAEKRAARDGFEAILGA